MSKYRVIAFKPGYVEGKDLDGPNNIDKDAYKDLIK